MHGLPIFEVPRAFAAVYANVLIGRFETTTHMIMSATGLLRRFSSRFWATGNKIHEGLYQYVQSSSIFNFPLDIVVSVMHFGTPVPSHRKVIVLFRFPSPFSIHPYPSRYISTGVPAMLLFAAKSSLSRKHSVISRSFANHAIYDRFRKQP